MVTAMALWEVNQNQTGLCSFHPVFPFLNPKIKNGKRSGYKK
jgi:hypothetical protein